MCSMQSFILKSEFSVNLLITGNGLSGMRQKDLIQWYVDQQNERNNYSSMEEVQAEISKIKAIIEVYFLRVLATHSNAFFLELHLS